MPELNVDLIQRVMKRIERDEENWDQQSWASVHKGSLQGSPTIEVDGDQWSALDDVVLLSGDACGTTFCFAGHTVLEAGETILVDKYEFESDNPLEVEYCLDRDGNLHSIENRAQELLGLTPIQARALFDGEAGNRNLDRYKEHVTAMTEVTFG